MSRTIEQQRAAHALRQVRTLLSSDGGIDRGTYRSYVDRLSPTIVMSGLGQALAMELAAGGNTAAHRALYDALTDWLCRDDGGVYPGTKDLLRSIVEGEERQYLAAQAEALAWLEWHKKFCRAELPAADRVD